MRGDLPRRLEKRRVQAEMHPAHVDVDALAVHARSTRVSNSLARLHELEQLVRNKMTVDIRDHGSQPQIGDFQPLVLEQIGAHALHDDPAVLEHVGAVGDLQDMMHVLLHDQDRVLWSRRVLQ